MTRLVPYLWVALGLVVTLALWPGSWFIVAEIFR